MPVDATAAYDPDNLFARILRGEIPCRKAYEDEHALAFHDINPQAPVHMLIIPKQAIATTNDIRLEDREIVGHLFYAAGKIAKEQGFAEDGYRLVLNCNDHGGQTVLHIHVHLLAGKPLGWPPYTDRLKV